MRRRTFLKSGAVAGFAISWCGVGCVGRRAGPGGPRVISTWGFGLAANAAAMRVLDGGGTPLDAVERGVGVPEGDPAVTSVGYGGLPNRDGVVELDAAIIDGSNLQAGSVAALRDIRHPVSVARRVMERTPHVLLVGEGARRFALEQGFTPEELLTPAARKTWEEQVAGEAVPAGHDTIGMVALDGTGRMAAACTTSGLAWKLPGRVGDSPLVGHGVYCDGKVGGAAATGVGEEVIKVCGSYQVVEFMRQGVEPREAVRRVLRRILERDPRNARRFVGFVALRADGEVGHASTTQGFEVAVSGGGRHEVLTASALLPHAADG